MTFSKKYEFSSTPTIQFRHDAPEGLRYAVIQAAHNHLTYDQIRTSVCRTLNIAPDRDNWSGIPNIRDEVECLLNNAEWYRVYDVIEDLVLFMKDTFAGYKVDDFVSKINEIFVDIGAGWQLVADAGIMMRGDADFEETVADARRALLTTRYEVAEKEIREALADLSRRPEADLTGAIHHALGSLEATLRCMCNSNERFSSLVKTVDLPKPLDEVLKKMWGFSSNFGRHVSPTNVPTAREARLVVHMSSAFCRYLVDSHEQ